jgi:anthranilate synthase component 1
LPDFCGGAVGYLGYETIRRLEELPSPDSDPLALPESLFMLVDTLLIFDHAQSKIKIVSLASPDGDDAYRAAVAKIDELAARLRQPLEPPHPTPPPRKSSGTPETVSNLTRAEFEANVAKAREYITEGEAIQIVLSQRLSRRTVAQPLAIYRALRRINPSPYMFFLDFKGFQLIGSSPEILVRALNGTVTTRPLAGTRPRGKTPAEDKRLEKELPADLEVFVSRVKELVNQPLCVGFGISTPSQAKRVARLADGVIVGSRIIQLMESGDIQPVGEFVRGLREALG